VDKIIRKPELFERVPLSDNTIRRMEAAGRFPKRIQLGDNSVGWLQSEIEAYFAQKAAERGNHDRRE
jgi:prophage regulatory protein